MRFLCGWVLASILLCVSSLHAEKASAEGMPLPWPFPWAKECPMDWSSMQGRYLLSDSTNLDHIDLKISVINKNGFKLVRVTRLSQTGEVLYDGFTFVNEKQRSIRLYLVPANSADVPVWAVIKLYYQNAEFQCTADHLVPILSVEPADASPHPSVQYRLVKVKGDDD